MVINSNSIRKLIFVHIIFVMFFLLLYQFGLPRGFVYLLDLFVCLEIIWSSKKITRIFAEAKFTFFLKYLIIFFCFLVFTQVINAVPLSLGIYAYRRSFRYILFFIACACLLSLKDVDKIFSFLLKLQIINFILTIYQYFAYDVSMDYVGGIFGVNAGVNGYTNIYLCIICIYVIVQYLEKKTKLKYVIWIIASSLLIGAMIELKVFFFELALIVILAIVFSKPSARTIKILVICVTGFVAAIILFASLFPEHMAILVDKELFMEYTTGVTWGYNISRLNAFSDINTIFFNGNIFENLFGYGFGNCEEGSVFFSNFGEYHYTWFTHQVTFLETGYIGFILYILYYIFTYGHATISKRKNPLAKSYYTIVQITSVLCMILSFYNQSLRLESAYLIFFVLAVSVIASRNDQKELEEIN